jgi:hypothetical protein
MWAYCEGENTQGKEGRNWGQLKTKSKHEKQRNCIDDGQRSGKVLMKAHIKFRRHTLLTRKEFRLDEGNESTDERKEFFKERNSSTVVCEWMCEKGRKSSQCMYTPKLRPLTQPSEGELFIEEFSLYRPLEPESLALSSFALQNLSFFLLGVFVCVLHRMKLVNPISDVGLLFPPVNATKARHRVTECMSARLVL